MAAVGADDVLMAFRALKSVATRAVSQPISATIMRTGMNLLSSQKIAGMVSMKTMKPLRAIFGAAYSAE